MMRSSLLLLSPFSPLAAWLLSAWSSRAAVASIPSSPPGANGKKPAAPRTNSARLAGFLENEVLFLAVAWEAGTVTLR